MSQYEKVLSVNASVLRPLLPPCSWGRYKSWSQPTDDAMKLQRLQRLQGPFPPARLQSRKKLYPPSTSHLAGVVGAGGGRRRRDLSEGEEKGRGQEWHTLPARCWVQDQEIRKILHPSQQQAVGRRASLAAQRDGRIVQKVSNSRQHRRSLEKWHSKPRPAGTAKAGCKKTEMDCLSLKGSSMLLQTYKTGEQACYNISVSKYIHPF